MDKFLIKKSKSNNQSDQENNEPSAISGKTSENSKDLKRKPVRKFNNDWEKLYFVIEQNSRAICLLCRADSDNRKYNVERHFNGQHADINEKFPLSSDKRARELDRLKKSFHSEQNVVKRFLTKNELATLASYDIAFKLAKQGKSYANGDFFKNLMSSTIELVCSNMNDNVKNQVLDNVKMIQLSEQTVSRRVNDIGAEIEIQLKKDLEQCEWFSLALDESKDIRDIAQLVFWVRYTIDKKKYHENILALVPLNAQTRGEDIFNAFLSTVDRFNLDMKKLASACSDGAPPMTGDKVGFMARLKAYLKQNNVQHELIVYHCIIHQENLCAKAAEKSSIILKQITKVSPDHK